MARTIFVLVAAGMFALAGFAMVSLRSVGGNTVAEAFYQYMGLFSFGMAALTVVIGTSARSPQPPTTPSP